MQSGGRMVEGSVVAGEPPKSHNLQGEDLLPPYAPVWFDPGARLRRWRTTFEAADSRAAREAPPLPAAVRGAA
jgi:hypothetical protein